MFRRGVRAAVVERSFNRDEGRLAQAKRCCQRRSCSDFEASVTFWS
jgi:hypothetical protein